MDARDKVRKYRRHCLVLERGVTGEVKKEQFKIVGKE